MLIIGTLLTTNYVFAQTKTPYEKKKEALSLQLLKDLGVSPATIKKYADAGDIGALFFLGNISEKLNTERGMLLLLKYNNDLKKAESLKNATDRKRDEEKRLAEQRKKEAEQEKQRERERQREIAEQEEQRQRDFKNSDYYEVATDIKKEYEKWATKGEFEKSTDYDNRIANEAKQMFSKICFDEIYNKIGVYETTYQPRNSYSNYEYPIKIDLGEYDADQEQFNATLTAYRNYSNNDIANIIIKVPMNEAKSFKETFSHNSYRLLANTNDWCFDNNNFLPKKITIKMIKGENTDKSYVAITQVNNPQNIIIKSENLKIENLSTSFNYNQEAPIILEKIRKKQLEEEEQNRIKKEKEIELKKKQENDKLFKEKIDRIESADNVARKGLYDNNGKLLPFQQKDFDEFEIYNERRIKLYQEALELKDDDTAKQKLDECQMLREELKTIKSKKKKENLIINSFIK